MTTVPDPCGGTKGRKLASENAAEEELESALRSVAGPDEAVARKTLEVLRGLDLCTGSQVLEQARSEHDAAELQRRVEGVAAESISQGFVADLCAALQSGRMVLGMPDPPPKRRQPVLFTAPHSLYLARQGHSHHLPEFWTSRLARSFAHGTQGMFLVWTKQEEARVATLYQRSGAPDPTNADPNYIHSDQLAHSPWTKMLNNVRSIFGSTRPCLHVDLHGCRDPGPNGPDKAAHLIVGLRAMEHAGRVGDAACLRCELLKAFSHALPGLAVNMRPVQSLTGAWEGDRCTMTQQSMSEEGGTWTHAVQLEMSISLRNKLSSDKELRILLARGIYLAWRVALARRPDSSGNQSEYYTMEMAQWRERCAELHRRGHGTVAGESPATSSPTSSPDAGEPLAVSSDG